MIRRLPPAFRARLTRPGFWAAAWVLWFTLLCILSSMSHPGPQIDVVGIDKVEHTIYFAAGGTCLALTLALALRRRPSKWGANSPSISAPAFHGSQYGAGPGAGPRLEGEVPLECDREGSVPIATADGMTWGKIALVVILTGAAVGWLDEWHQSFTPGRFGLDQYDWMADVLGSTFALPIARRLHRGLSGPEERT